MLFVSVQNCCLCVCVWVKRAASLQLHWACAGRRCAFDSSRRKRGETAARADKQHTKRTPVLWNRTGRGFITRIGEFYVSLSWTQRYSLHVGGEKLLLRRMRSRCSFWVDEEHPVVLLPWQPMMMRIFTAIWQGSQRMRFFEISNSLCVVSIHVPSRKSMFNWNLARSPAGVPVILMHHPQYLLLMAHFRNVNIWFGYSFIFIWGLDRPVVTAWRQNIAVYSH